MDKIDLEDAVKALIKWYGMSSLGELLAADIGSLKNVANIAVDPSNNLFTMNEDKLTRYISEIIIDTQLGCYNSYTLVKKINQFYKGLQATGATLQSVKGMPIVALFHPDKMEQTNFVYPESISDVLADQSVGENVHAPTKQSPTACVFLVNSKQISLSSKNAKATTLFMNSIPTHEWSRAAPFLDIKILLHRSSVAANGDANTPSIVKFLQGGKSLHTSEQSSVYAMDLKLQTALSKDATEQGVMAEAGMELFTMPQTLNDVGKNGQRDVQVLDEFRPLASLKSFNIDISQSHGSEAYRKGRIVMVLHDRSRMAELADFLKPGLYNRTEILAEYGWQHPDNGSQNVFGKFINALRVKEKFSVVNHKFKFKNNGEVDIELDIATKGALDLYSNTIHADTEVEKKKVLVQQLQEKIKEYRSTIFKDDKTVKEIRASQVLNTASDHTAEISLTPEMKTEIANFIKTLDGMTSPNATGLRKALVALFGEGSKIGSESTAIGALHKSVADAIKNKMDRISQGPSQTADPFLRTEKIDGAKGEPRSHVSVAKLMTMFVVQPLLQSRQFDDIQLIFYPLNGKAGKVRGHNIGSLGISISSFMDKFTRLAKARKTANLSIRDFVSFIAGTYFDDMAGPFYGLSSFYNVDTNKESYGKSNAVAKNPDKLQFQIEQEVGDFELPQIDVYVECLPGRDSYGNKMPSMTILRIHILDRQASTYKEQSDFLAAQRDTTLVDLREESLKVANDNGDVNKMKLLIKEALQRGLLEVSNPIAQDPSYRFKANGTQVKEFIAQTMPSIIYGGSNTAVLDGGLESLYDSNLSTIHMNRAGDNGDMTAKGGATNGLPIRVFPAQLNIRMMGCPLLEFTQAFFCDFQTGTTLDNVYQVTKIEHAVEAGKFITSVTMTPGDAYGVHDSVLKSVGMAINKLSNTPVENS